MLPVTSPTEGALSVIAKKEGLDIIPHPDVGGRFSGLTSSALAPALFFNMDIDNIDNGARAMYARCAPSVRIEENPALQLACVLYLLEKKRYSEIFCPIYSSKLACFSNLIVQLMHESVCKKGRGQTIYCADAPESQHHTNQRFFGGKKNVLGLFVTVNEQHDSGSRVKVPEPIKHIAVRGGTLGDIDNVPYHKSLEFEFEGTFRDAVSKKIPCIRLSLDKISAFSVGEFTGFWHYVAVYSAILRDVNPYDQPEVEYSKEISFELRKRHKL
jgi:glucose-6-phosphate isomerase